MTSKQTGFVRLSDLLDPKLIFPRSSGRTVSPTFANIEIWNAEAETIWVALQNLSIRDAVRYIEKHPPSAGVIALLAFVAQDRSKSDQGRRGAMARIAKDPKQKDKTAVFECWRKWQLEPANYKSKAAFARDMLSKYENLKSQKKIEDWCREWEAKSGTQQAQ
jgi:hypothetical protein